MSGNITKTNKEIIENARQLIGYAANANHSIASQYQSLVLELSTRLAEADAKLSIYEKRPIPLTKP